ncbi:MAG: PepSY domain-containing protein, partial [Bacteroidota bacterium]
LSIWRLSHMVLALSTSIFLVLASLTGLILAFEPMGTAVGPDKTDNLKDIPLATTRRVMDSVYTEVITIEVDRNDRVVASVVNDNGNSETIFVDPLTGEKLGRPKEKARIFQFTTNLHRSLFLKGIGRFFVGLVSFLLCLIALTGFLLILKRQGGIRKLFSKVQKEGFELYYHVSLGRWMLIPVLLVAATGVYLSLEKFSLLPSPLVHHELPASIAETMTENKAWTLPVFKNTPLDQVRKLTYPFSEFPEDYFELALKQKEMLVHQYTGESLSEKEYPFTNIALRWSMLLHTGQGSFWWSLVLVLVSLAILFFIYSGVVLWSKRRKKSKELKFAVVDKDEANIILLVGSETGNTFEFAKILQNALLEVGVSTAVAQLNEYTQYASARHLIVLTATYGEGEAPTNARNFHKRIASVSQDHVLRYSVVGFGSLLYPDYCGFAITADKLLKMASNLKELVPLYKINNQDFRAFQDWSRQWSAATDIAINLQAPLRKKKRSKAVHFRVAQRSALNNDNTFVLRLKPAKSAKFHSGDLAGVVPEDGQERQYSIAKIGKEMVLSVKKHEYGVCSTYLSSLAVDDMIPITLKRNPDFYFPRHAPGVILIANGTGIAPFLGMLAANTEQVPVYLFFGLRNKDSFTLYEKLLAQYPPTQLEVAYSQAQGKAYVQDILAQRSKWITEQLEGGTVVMICGSLAMQQGVLDVLEDSCKKHLQKPLSEFENQEQLKTDCY